MGLFGKLFDKKECSICGGEIGLLGNRKLEDGNLCKACAGKLSPWFDDIHFRLNSSTVSVEERKAGNATTIRLGGAALNFGDKFDPKQSVEYCQYKEMGEEIKAALMQARQQAREEKAAAEAPKVAVMCPFCGAQTIPDAKGCCEYCGGALGK